MEFFGIGGFELIGILVVALLVLGPERMVDVARTAGKWWREAQLAVRTMADAATTKLDEEPPSKRRSAPPSDPIPSPEDSVARGGGSDDEGGPTSTGSDTPSPEDAPQSPGRTEPNDPPRAG
jgi:Sec-independent protein translocase protein TatA